MNPAPIMLRLWGGWQSIRQQVDDWAIANGYETYTAAPEQYRFYGWGTVGFPPRIACNVLLFRKDADTVDAGRFVA